MNARVDTITKFLKHLSTKINELDKVVNERIPKAIKQDAAVQADDAIREQVTKFVVEHLKDYTFKLLPVQLKENDVAFVESVSEVKELRMSGRLMTG